MIIKTITHQSINCLKVLCNNEISPDEYISIAGEKLHSLTYAHHQNFETGFVELLKHISDPAILGSVLVDIIKLNFIDANDIVKMLIDRGADVNYIKSEHAREQLTPLLAAKTSMRKDIIDQLKTNRTSQ